MNGGLYVPCSWKGNENHHIGTGFLVHQRIISEVKGVELVSDGMLYIVRRVYCCDIIF